MCMNSPEITVDLKKLAPEQRAKIYRKLGKFYAHIGKGYLLLADFEERAIKRRLKT